MFVNTLGIGMAMGLALLASGGSSEPSTPQTVGVAPINFDALFVVNGGDNTISVINTETNQVAGAIRLRGATYPHHISLSRDGTRLLLAAPGVDMSHGHSGHGHSGHGHSGHSGHGIADDSTPAVLMLDASTGNTLAATRLPMMNHNAIFSPDGREIWTSQMVALGSVLVLDAATLTVLQSIEVGDSPAEVTFSEDGRRAFVADNGSNEVSVVDPATKGIVQTIAVGQGPVGAWMGSDDVMYVDCEHGMTVNAIDARTLNVIRTYDLGFMPGMAATAPSGELWVTDSDDGAVVFYSTTSTQRLGQLATGAGAHAIAFSADGATGYVTNQAANTVSVIDVASHTLTDEIQVGMAPNGLVWRGR